MKLIRDNLYMVYLGFAVAVFTDLSISDYRYWALGVGVSILVVMKDYYIRKETIAKFTKMIDGVSNRSTIMEFRKFIDKELENLP